ncbi:uracil-DNA glycosylase [Bradyrhizobium sp.]|uniref:uracil-DNA glycosylase n=1 Tax=Bradyrhizobium sp. TaxID=376 RepID=UPI001DFCCE07|nr:uracil-DNA glycosylase [Bradyrhizobium sp.]MBI5319984.1 uracil-DNA glycosylase [Bradyrhizobium sp.]
MTISKTSLGLSPTEPDLDCPLCPRLAAFRAEARAREPNWHNAPVASFGDPGARVLIVGLAPGLQGANRTGRPFTGDYAGDLLYSTLLDYGFAKGKYEARPDDGLALVDCRISNAVRCVPPQNKPLPAEINTCRTFLAATMATMPKLAGVVLLGRVAHDSTLKAVGLKAAAAPFAHGAVHKAGNIRLYDSYHCSRYNTNTGVLTPKMFRDVFARVRKDLG